MGVVLAVKCDGCDYSQELETKSRQYELDDDEWLPIEPALGWCKQCASVQEVELLPELEETTERVRALKAKDPTVVAELEAQGRFAEDEVEFHEMILAWLKDRRSPARCLECESTEFVLVFEPDLDSGEYKRKESEHPECGGRLDISGLTVRPSGEPLIYSPEGELLE